MPSCSTKQTPLFHLSHSQALSRKSLYWEKFIPRFHFYLAPLWSEWWISLSFWQSNLRGDVKFSDRPLWACCCIDLVHFLLYHGVCGYVLHMVVWPCWILDFRLREEPSLLASCFEMFWASLCVFGQLNPIWLLEPMGYHWKKTKIILIFGLLVWNSFLFSFWVLASTCEFCGRVIQILNN